MQDLKPESVDDPQPLKGRNKNHLIERFTAKFKENE